MNIFEMNLAVMKETKPILFEKIEKHLEKGMDSSKLNIVSQKSRDNNVVFTIERNGQSFRLNSAYKPEEEAKRWVEQYDLKNLDMNIVMFGIGSGIFAETLLKNMGEDGKLYLYEPGLEIFLCLLKEVDITSLLLDGRALFYVVGLNEKDFFYDLSAMTHWSNLSTQFDCYHPKYVDIFPEECEQFRDWIFECDATEIVNKNTGVDFAKAMTINALGNIHFIADGNNIQDFQDKFDKELPAILVAAGPSLEKNIHVLKQAENKAFIIATDTAVRYLLQEKIHFDCMVTVDPRKPADYLMVPGCQDIPLFCTIESNAEILNYHTGKKIWFQDSGRYLTELYNKYHKEFITADTGGNVAASAWSISRFLGFKRIVLVGQDLAYLNGETHAGGVNNEASKIKGYVEGIDGNMVLSRSDWLSYLEWYEREIATYSDEIDAIDATEGGAKIHGARIMTLQEVVDKYCVKEFDVSRIFTEGKPSFQKERQEVKKDLLHIKNEFRNIASKAGSAMEAAKKALKLLEEDTKLQLSGEYIKELTKANKFIEKQRIYSVLENYIEDESVEVLEKINVITGDAHEDQKTTISALHEYYRIMKKAVSELQPVIEEALKKIQAL